MREVERKAKVGEYIKIINRYTYSDPYNNGDIFKVTESDDDFVKNENEDFIYDTEYIVLEDYNCPTKYEDYETDEETVKSFEDLEKKCIELKKEINIIINKNKEEEEMNKVLELWRKRKLDKLNKEYQEGEKEYKDNLVIVKNYNELVEKFERDMQDLYIMDEEHKLIKQKDEPKFYMYYLDNEYISDRYRELKCEEFGKKEKEINDVVEEVEAQLSLSNDLDYQREVLKNYGIIDKKTNKLVD